MKKVLLATAFVALVLGGCSSNYGEDKPVESAVAESSVKAESTEESSSGIVASTSESSMEEADKFAGQAEVGEGTLDLVNESGNTADGADIVVYYDENTFPTYVDISTSDVNGGSLSYIYVDGQLVAKEQLGTSQTPIELQDTAVAIKEGKHTVQLVQYDTDKEGGNIITFKTQEYTLKVK